MSETKDYKAWLTNMIEDGMQLKEYGSEEDWVMYQDILRLIEDSKLESKEGGEDEKQSPV